MKIFRVAALLFLFANLSGCGNKKAAGELYIRALDAYEQKDFESALAFINQSLKCDKKNKQAIFLKAQTRLFQGQYEKASKLFLDLYKKNSDNKDIQIYLIQSLILSKDYKNAKQEIQDALKKDMGDWRLHHFASVVAAKENDAQRRLECLNQAQKALGLGAQVYLDLAFAWQSLGLEAKAEECRDKCLCLDKNYRNFFSVQGGAQKEEKSE